MRAILPLAALLGVALLLSGCVSTPAPQYQSSIANTETLLQQRPHLSVGEFSAAPEVENRSLTIRGLRLQGGGRDGTFSTYLRDALIAELRTGGCYDEADTTRVSGVLTRNEIEVPIKVGKVTLAAEFTVSRRGTPAFQKTLLVQHEWESSFMGAIAIPTAIDNYSAAAQKLLAKLFADADFIAATRTTPPPAGSPP